VTFTQECVIPVDRERLWDFMMEVPRVASCVPGVEAVEPMDSGAYRGSLKEANDRRLGGGIRARLGLTLAPGESGTHLRIDTDLAILGKIGEFGQPVIKKKADAILAEFARNLQTALAV
jgi:carbon monoxide dehydrogenase subunit G